MRFTEWIEEVNRLVGIETGGVDINDLPDIDYRSIYEDGALPEAAVSEVLYEAGFIG